MTQTIELVDRVHRPNLPELTAQAEHEGMDIFLAVVAKRGYPQLPVFEWPWGEQR